MMDIPGYDEWKLASPWDKIGSECDGECDDCWDEDCCSSQYWMGDGSDE